MYSYEDRIRAVRLYIKLGKRIGATLRQLSYPTMNALKSWHHEYAQGGDLRVGFVPSRSKYSAEQKRVAVEHYLNHDRCIAATRKALGYPCRDTLEAWIDELHPETRVKVVSKAQSIVLPQEDKQAAVIALSTRQISAQAIAENIGVSRPTLYKWKNQLLGREAPASMTHHTIRHQHLTWRSWNGRPNRFDAPSGNCSLSTTSCRRPVNS